MSEETKLVQVIESAEQLDLAELERYARADGLTEREASRRQRLLRAAAEFRKRVFEADREFVRRGRRERTGLLVAV